MWLNFGGYKWLWFDGYGRLTLGVAKALIRAGHEVYPFEVEILDKPGWFLRAQGLDFSRSTVMLMPPHMMKHIPGRNFCWSMHESTNLPEGWADHVNRKSQWLLVPSPWLVEVFEEGGVEVPIEVVPGGIDPEECEIVRPNNNRPFTFGCLADRGFRKAYDLVETAFYKAFDYRDMNVRLLIKCRPGSLLKRGLVGLDFSYSRDPRIAVWEADIPNVADIYSQMDAFMFPSRCEGYGMPPRESAACGVPTVVVRWSGTADDCDSWATPLEKFKLIESGMEDCGGLWAEPDLDELIWRMRDLYENRDRYRKEALVKAQWLRDNQTYALAADKLVKTMSKHLGGPLHIEKPPENGKTNQAAIKLMKALAQK